ncbi:MAG: phosphotransferase family protein [Deinococcales bacterium]
MSKSSKSLDSAGNIRQGEALATGKLENYLKNQLDLAGSLSIQQFPSGFSNLTYLLRLGDCELVLRRPPFGVAIKGGHDMGREYRVLKELYPHYPKVPKTLLYCEDESIIGAPFYVMERLYGVILRAKMPKSLQPDPKLMAEVAINFIKSFAELHAVPLSEGLSQLGRPEGYVRRQVEGWTRRYEAAKTEEIPQLDEAAQWLAAHMPAESAIGLIHNDFKYDNVMLNPDNLSEIIAVLDWEMATIGDPLMDLGSSLGYWTQKDDPSVMQDLGLSPTALAGNPSRKDVVALYEEFSGCEVKEPVFYYVYGLFKLAVILQQIYKRYVSGHSQDERFAGLILAVKACGEMAARALNRNSL